MEAFDYIKNFMIDLLSSMGRPIERNHRVTTTPTGQHRLDFISNSEFDLFRISAWRKLSKSSIKNTPLNQRFARHSISWRRLSALTKIE